MLNAHDVRSLNRLGYSLTVVVNRMRKETMALFLPNRPRQRRQACMMLMPKLYLLSQLFVWNDIVWIGKTTRSWAVIVNVISVISLRENSLSLRRKERIVPLFDPVKLFTNLNYLKQNTENFPFVNYKMIAREETTKENPRLSSKSLLFQGNFNKWK